MRLIEGLSIGISAIRANKMRSLLTMLGIIIGVAAVLAMIAIGDGAKEIVLQDAQKLGGANQFTMYRTWYKQGAGGRWTRVRSNEYMEYGDVLAIEAECPSVSAVTPRIPEWRGSLIQAADGSETRAGYNGVDATYQIAMDWNVQAGRFITEEDVEQATTICVLGDEVATTLFGNKSPLGQEIKNCEREWSLRQMGSQRQQTLYGTFHSCRNDAGRAGEVSVSVGVTITSCLYRSLQFKNASPAMIEFRISLSTRIPSRRFRRQLRRSKLLSENGIRGKTISLDFSRCVQAWHN